MCTNNLDSTDDGIKRHWKVVSLLNWTINISSWRTGQSEEVVIYDTDVDNTNRLVQIHYIALRVDLHAVKNSEQLEGGSVYSHIWMCFPWISESSYATSGWWWSILYSSLLSRSISGHGSSTSNCSNSSRDAGSKIRETNTPQWDCKVCSRKPHIHADANFILHLLPFSQPHSLSSTHNFTHRKWGGG